MATEPSVAPTATSSARQRCLKAVLGDGAGEQRCRFARLTGDHIGPGRRRQYRVGPDIGADVDEQISGPQQVVEECELFLVAQVDEEMISRAANTPPSEEVGAVDERNRDHSGPDQLGEVKADVAADRSEGAVPGERVCREMGPAVTGNSSGAPDEVDRGHGRPSMAS